MGGDPVEFLGFELAKLLDVYRATILWVSLSAKPWTTKEHRGRRFEAATIRRRGRMLHFAYSTK